MIYLIVFAISILCVNLAYKIQGKKRFFFLILAVLIPSLLAAFRSEIIGTDTSFYVKNSFNNARYYLSYWDYQHYYPMEPLYNLLVFFAQKTTNNIQFLYFLFEIVILGFTMGACYHERDKVPIYYSYGFFLLLYYNRSLNMVRQSLALSVILFAFYFVRKKKLIKYLFFVFIALGFHRTAIFAIMLYLIAKLVGLKHSFIFKVFITLFSIVFLFFYKNIIMLLINLNIINQNFIYYTTSEGNFIILIEFARKFLFLVIFLLLSRTFKKNKEENSVLIFYMTLDFILYCISFKANYAQRISYYFGYFDIFLLPQLITYASSKNSRKALKVLLIFGFILYWYVYYCVLKYDQTYPYVSIFH